MEKVRVGLIGHGQRGYGILKHTLALFENVIVTAVCDIYEDRVQSAKAFCDEKYGIDTFGTQDWREMIDKNKVDAIIICSAWESHVPISIACMEAGIPVATEVGGAYSIDQCWQLVRTQERTGTKFMFLENCCYVREEMMVMNMAHQGLFGDIMYCTGGYLHDLRDEITGGFINRHYRLRNYLKRNCENYPTHQLGPICKILNVNNGNRLLSLSSMSSGAKGLKQFAARKSAEGNSDYDALAVADYAQGDIISTNIRCANGALIQLTLGTSLPRPYGRNFNVMGTKGAYFEDTRSIYLESDHTERDGSHWDQHWNNRREYREKYDHPVWKKYLQDGVFGGHGGCDTLVYAAFIDYVMDKIECPIDVYDAATWMCISTLSEDSIAMGGAPVAIPDFTDGKWLLNADKEPKLFGV